MQLNVLIFLCLAGVLGNARTSSDILQESDDSDMFFDDRLIDSTQLDKLFDVDPSIGLDEAINLDQDPSLLAEINGDCTSPTESPEPMMDRIRVRRQSCFQPKSTPPPPKVQSPSLKSPEEFELQPPWFGGFPIPPPFIKSPQCNEKMPYCCPSGRMPDNTFQGCKLCETYRFSFLLNRSSKPLTKEFRVRLDSIAAHPWLCGNPLFIYCCDYVDVGTWRRASVFPPSTKTNVFADYSFTESTDTTLLV